MCPGISLPKGPPEWGRLSSSDLKKLTARMTDYREVSESVRKREYVRERSFIFSYGCSEENYSSPYDLWWVESRSMVAYIELVVLSSFFSSSFSLFCCVQTPYLHKKLMLILKESF